MKVRTKLARLAQTIWQGRGLTSTLLLPLSWLVRGFVAYKTYRFRKYRDLVWHARVPVIVVGNVYAGGTGKTPVVMALAQALLARGWQPGVISRGYGVTIKDHARAGRGNLEATQFGDEPALIARNTGAPVAVHPQRAKAAQTLLAQYPESDVIISDDGLQHLSLGRDIEIAVQDHRKIGNGRLLPAGPLREPASRLARVDVLITNMTDSDPPNVDTSSDIATPPGPGRPELAAHAPKPPPLAVAMKLTPASVVQLSTGRRLHWPEWAEQHSGRTATAIAAIGNPKRFFDMLREHGVELVQECPLPDHAAIHSRLITDSATTLVLVTAKDAVKCETTNDDRLWAVEVSPTFWPPNWTDVIIDRIACGFSTSPEP